jgi:hypothetical protein
MFEYLDKIREIVNEAMENLSEEDFDSFIEEAENLLNEGWESDEED